MVRNRLLQSLDAVLTTLYPPPDFLEACWKFFILGIIQGVTEFLPISSTAHLKALPVLMGWEDPGVAVTAVIQLGSIFAVITYFRRDLKQVLKAIALAFNQGKWREPNARLGIAIGLGTVTILLAGMVIKVFQADYETSFFRSIPSIGLVSILMGLLLVIAEKTGQKLKCLNKVTGKEGLIIGLGQMLALFPGVSRSGITLTTALFNGWQRQDAARFSFLLGIPAITIAGLVELKNALNQNLNGSIIPLLVGIFSSAIVSWLAIDWLLKYLQSSSTYIFIIYRLSFGVALLLWWSYSS